MGVDNDDSFSSDESSTAAEEDEICAKQKGPGQKELLCQDSICFQSETGVSEIKGESESVALLIDNSNNNKKSDNSSSAESLSCCEALDWNENHNNEKHLLDKS